MKFRICSLFLLLSFIIISCGGKKEEPAKEGAALSAQDETELMTRAKTMFGVLPDKMPGSENDSPAMIELGKKLYSETKLSATGTQSCNSCHDLTNNMAGVDNHRVSPGAHPGKEGTRNSPTVLNAGFQFVQFWDGRAADLVEQAKGPILNPVEMAMKSAKDCETIIGKIPEYKDLFDKAFPNDKPAVSYNNIAKAIAAFERTLVSKGRYDKWIEGDQNALTANEKQGLKTFIDVNCTICHIGSIFGGSIYQKMGLAKPFANTKDMGRFEVTKQESDKYMFKVPMLRNVMLTAPYFHDGSAATIQEAIKTMADIQLGKTLTDDQTKAIEAFFWALTDTQLEKAKKK